MGALGDTVLHEVDDGVATITMNRPDAGNALLPEQRDAIIELLGAAEHRPRRPGGRAARQGRHFCTGADVGSIQGAQSAEPIVGDGMRRIQGGAQRLIAAVLDCAKPVVAVVQGPAAGLGAHLAFACDLVVAADSAYFLEPFLLRGSWSTPAAPTSCPASSGCSGPRSSRSWATSSRPPTPRGLGLVNRVVPAERARRGRRRAARPSGRRAHRARSRSPSSCSTGRSTATAPRRSSPRRWPRSCSRTASTRPKASPPSASGAHPEYRGLLTGGRSASLSTFSIGVRGSASSDDHPIGRLVVGETGPAPRPQLVE